jgi:hypothetical protein
MVYKAPPCRLLYFWRIFLKKSNRQGKKEEKKSYRPVRTGQKRNFTAKAHKAKIRKKEP